MIEAIITGAVCLVLGFGGGYFIMSDDNPDAIDNSKIGKQTKREASLSSQYANCLDAMRSGKGVGQNIKDCAKLGDAIVQAHKEHTFEGKLENLKKCIEAQIQYPKKITMNCETKIFGGEQVQKETD